jgi:hypothetical protein
LPRTAIQTSRRALRDAGVLDLLGPLAAHVRDRPSTARITSATRDLRRLLREPVAALGAALALHQAGVLQVEQDVLEELERDASARWRADRP